MWSDRGCKKLIHRSTLCVGICIATWVEWKRKNNFRVCFKLFIHRPGLISLTISRVKLSWTGENKNKNNLLAYVISIQAPFDVLPRNININNRPTWHDMRFTWRCCYKPIFLVTNFLIMAYKVYRLGNLPTKCEK